MTTMSPDAAQLELQRRVRRYFIVVVGALVGAFALPFVLGAVLQAAGVEKQPAGTVAGIAGLVGMFTVVALSWFLVYRWWRCPVCDRNVYWVVSTNMSIFAATASKTCPGCGTQLIAPGAARRFFIRLALIAAVFIALGVLAGLTSASERRTPASQHTAPPG
jgi:hypothetical protein